MLVPLDQKEVVRHLHNEVRRSDICRLLVSSGESTIKVNLSCSVKKGHIELTQKIGQLGHSRASSSLDPHVDWSVSSTLFQGDDRPTQTSPH